MTQYAARVGDLQKWFGGAHALRGVTVAFETGDVHAVAGENGAGKSTLVKILSGVIGADDYTGCVEIGGERRRLYNIRDAERHGVFLVPQELNIVPELRIGEYLFLNREPRRWCIVDSRKLWADTAHWLKLFQLDVSPLQRMEELTTHEQQLVSIARAMTQGVKLLILDEPTASLTEKETELLFARVAELHRHGVTTIYISHRLHEFERIANVVTVMRDGAVVDHFRLERSGDTPRRVIRAMVGRDLTDMYPKKPAPIGEPLLELKRWTVEGKNRQLRDAVRDVDLTVRAGEVVGIFGLLGSGAFELARSMFAAGAQRGRGEMSVGGKAVSLKQPGDAIREGIAYLPAERKRDGLITSHPIATNMSLVALPRLTQTGLINRKAELKSIQQFVAGLHVKCDSVQQPIEQLSGGNQQKVVAAKWLMTEPNVLILEEPTRGVDVNARIDFYHLLNDLTGAGKAVVLVSTDLPEVLGMSDRIVAMHEGKLVKSWSRNEAREEDVMVHAAGEHEVAA